MAQLEITVVVSFAFSVVAILLAQWIWGYISGPRIVLSVKGLSAPHPVSKLRYYKIGIKNAGATAAEAALVRVRLERDGSMDKNIEATPKWDSTPEAPIAGFSFLFDAFQRIDIPPAGYMHEELVPIFIIPTIKMCYINKGDVKVMRDYEPYKIYLFSNFKHYSLAPVQDLMIEGPGIKGEISVEAKNCYVKYTFEATITRSQNSNDPSDINIEFTKLEAKRTKWWLFRGGKVENRN